MNTQKEELEAFSYEIFSANPQRYTQRYLWTQEEEKEKDDNHYYLKLKKIVGRKWHVMTHEERIQLFRDKVTEGDLQQAKILVSYYNWHEFKPMFKYIHSKYSNYILKILDLYARIFTLQNNQNPSPPPSRSRRNDDDDDDSFFRGFMAGGFFNR